MLRLATRSRLDLYLVASTLGFYLADANEAQVEAVKRALGYLKGTSNTGLLLKPDEHVQMSARSDANLGGKAYEKWRSRNGLLICYGYAVVCAVSSLQNCVPRSSTKAEHDNLVESCKVIA